MPCLRYGTRNIAQPLTNATLFRATGGIATTEIVKAQDRESGIAETNCQLPESTMAVDIFVPDRLANHHYALPLLPGSRRMVAAEKRLIGRTEIERQCWPNGVHQHCKRSLQLSASCPRLWKASSLGLI